MILHSYTHAHTQIFGWANKFWQHITILHIQTWSSRLNGYIILNIVYCFASAVSIHLTIHQKCFGSPPLVHSMCCLSLSLSYSLVTLALALHVAFVANTQSTLLSCTTHKMALENYYYYCCWCQQKSVAIIFRAYLFQCCIYFHWMK